jgi:outer membrane murein-binding lipoprotein Lpp
MNSRIFTLVLALLGLPVLAGAGDRRQSPPESSANIRQLLEFQRQHQADREAFARAFTAVTQTSSPLESVTNALVAEVLALRRDNDALRAELDALKTTVKAMQEPQDKAGKGAK